VSQGNRILFCNTQNDFAANYAKATTTRRVNGKETTNCAKIAKKRHSLSLLFSRPGRFLLSLANRSFFSKFAANPLFCWQQDAIALGARMEQKMD
jgi:hypothetical protein